MRFTVYGHPEPKGSTKAFLPKGSKFPVVTSDNKKTKPWQQQVTGVALANVVRGKIPFARPEPVSLTVHFFLARPKSLPKKLSLPTKKPDLDKLVRSVADALTGVVWDDDSQVVMLAAVKHYGTPERAEISIL